MFVRAIRCTECNDGFEMDWSRSLIQPPATPGNGLVCTTCGARIWVRAIGRKRYPSVWYKPWTWGADGVWEWREDVPHAVDPTLRVIK